MKDLKKKLLSEKWIIVLLLIIIVILFLVFRAPKSNDNLNLISPQVAGQKAVEYINTSGMADGSVTFSAVKEISSGLYEVTTVYQGQNLPVWVTRDGKYLFIGEKKILMENNSMSLDGGNTCAAFSPTEIPDIPDYVDWSSFSSNVPNELISATRDAGFSEPVKKGQIQVFENYPSCGDNVITFYFDWCEWSHRYNPVIINTQKKFSRTNFFALNIEDNSNLAEIWDVDLSPVTIISCKYKIEGYYTEEAMEIILNDLL